VLYLDGHRTTELSYAERRELLEGLQLKGGCWDTPPYFVDDGKAILDASRAQQLEGVVAKRLDSKYFAGRRSDCWLKIKNVRRQEVVIGGWTPGEGNRAGHIGSLLIGVHDEPGGRLLWSGNVGSGFTVKTLREMEELLKPLRRKTSPFANTVSRIQAKNATYVEPELVCEVEFTGWTRDGRIRHPVYKGLRDDKPARDVVREETP
jgi:bifunctional non-homologous end joining protein LigD